MNENKSLLIVAVVLGAAVCAALIFAMWQMGSGTLRTMGLIFVAGLALALVIFASAFPIKAARYNDKPAPPIVEHHYHDGTQTIIKETKVLDGRPANQTDIKLLQLPAQPQAGAYPDLLRAAFAAGATLSHSASPQNTAKEVGRE